MCTTQSFALSSLWSPANRKKKKKKEIKGDNQTYTYNVVAKYL